MEQWDNLKQYFLVFLPKQKSFVREIKEAARYKRIVQNLKLNLTLPYLAFVVFIAHSFDDFLVFFQSSEPLIHILYERMKDLLTKIMSYFIKKKYLVEEKDGKFVPKSFSSVLNVNVAKSDNHKAIKSVDVGTKCKSYFAESLIIDDEETSFRKQVVNFYVRVSQYLINNLPFDGKPIKDAQYINPLKRNDPHARTAISNLALEIIKVFSDKYASVFNVNSSIDSDQLCDIIRSQFQCYQLEDIPESLYIAESIVEEKQSEQTSYWKQAF